MVAVDGDNWILYGDDSIHLDIDSKNYYHVTMSHAFPVQLRGACPWLSTEDLLVDLYHARFSQDLHIGHEPSQ